MAWKEGTLSLTALETENLLEEQEECQASRTVAAKIPERTASIYRWLRQICEGFRSFFFFFFFGWGGVKLKD